MAIAFDLETESGNFLEDESGDDLILDQSITQDAINWIGASPACRLLDITGDFSYPVTIRSYTADFLSAKSLTQAFLWSNYYINDPYKATAPIRGMISNRIAEQPELAPYFPNY
jgi:hypothetical protein